MNSLTEPCLKLYGAIMAQAKEDMEVGPQPYFLAAAHWVFLDTRTGMDACSFLFYCEALDWEPERVRLAFKRALPGPRQTQLRELLLAQEELQ